MPAAVPPLYAPWIDEILGGAIPRERTATCRRCAMAPAGGCEGDSGRLFFDRTTLCCTYLPDLPNFLVGRILADGEASMARGRRTVEARMRRKVAVTPLGLGRSPVYALLYGNASDAFGRSRTLHCPHHIDGGGCSIWAHRCSMCAMWFCKHDRGAVGQRFWRALNALLMAVERGLAQWCALESKLEVSVLARLHPSLADPPGGERLRGREVDEQVEAERYAGLWGGRAGHERAYFVECGRRVGGLGWSEVSAICGPEVRLLAEVARAAYRELLSRELPSRLKVGTYVTLRSDSRSSLVASYSRYDPLSLPRELIDVLAFFDGRPVPEALRMMSTRKGVRLDRELVLRLADFAILTPADSER